MPVAVSSIAADQLINDTNNKIQSNANKAQLYGQQGILNAKAQQVANAKKSMDGSVLDSASKFVASGAGVMTNMKLAESGFNKMTPRENLDSANKAYAARIERERTKQGTQESNMANNGTASQLINNASDALSNSVGGGQMENQAKIADKVAEMSEQVSKNLQDGAAQTKDRAAKGIDSANDFQKSAQDRVQQTLMNLANRI